MKNLGSAKARLGSRYDFSPVLHGFIISFGFPLSFRDLVQGVEGNFVDNRAHATTVSIGLKYHLAHLLERPLLQFRGTSCPSELVLSSILPCWGGASSGLTPEHVRGLCRKCRSL